MQALVELGATLRLSLASGSLDGSACSFASAVQERRSTSDHRFDVVNEK